MARRISVQLIGDSASLERAFDKAGRKGREYETRTQKLTSNLKSLGKAGAAGVAVGGVALVTSSVVKGIAAAKEAQVAQARLRQALKASGASYERYGKQIDATIDKTSRLAGIDDEELSEAFSQLVRTTGSVTKATKGMNIAVNIARARGVSLTMATKAVERAFNGSDTALKRFGIRVPRVTKSVDALKEAKEQLRDKLKGATDAQKKQIEAQIEGIDAQMKAAAETDKSVTGLNALDKAQRKFAGSAESYGKTAAGAQERFAVAVENLQEKLGAKLLPVLTKLALWGVRFIDWSEKNWPKFERVVREQWEKVRGIFEAFKTFFGGWVKLISGIVQGDWSKAWKGVKQIVRGAFQGVFEFFKALPARFLAWGARMGAALARGILSQLGDLGKRIGNKVIPGDPFGTPNAGVSFEQAVQLAKQRGRTPSGRPNQNIDRRATGGPVSPFKTYLVGERGPELLRMGSQGGNVSPNAGGATIVIQNLNLPGVQNVQQLLSELQRVSRSHTQQRRGVTGGTRFSIT